jgi:hypothetical protein
MLLSVYWEGRCQQLTNRGQSGRVLTRMKKRGLGLLERPNLETSSCILELKATFSPPSKVIKKRSDQDISVRAKTNAFVRDLKNAPIPAAFFNPSPLALPPFNPR